MKENTGNDDVSQNGQDSLENKLDQDDLMFEPDSGENVDENDIQDSMKIEMELPDGSRGSFEVVSVFKANQDKLYMALHRVDDSDESSVIITPITESDNGEVQFGDFESEEEYNNAENAFYEG